MNKKKFHAKVKEIVAYEEKTLAEVENFLKPYNEKFEKQGIEIFPFLWWLDKN